MWELFQGRKVFKIDLKNHNKTGSLLMWMAPFPQISDTSYTWHKKFLVITLLLQCKILMLENVYLSIVLLYNIFKNLWYVFTFTSETVHVINRNNKLFFQNSRNHDLWNKFSTGSLIHLSCFLSGTKSRCSGWETFSTLLIVRLSGTRSGSIATRGGGLH